MKRAHSYLWSIVLAILPLIALYVLNHYVLTPQGWGVALELPWDQTTEPAETPAPEQHEVAKETPAQQAKKKLGTAQEPLQLFILGASPTLMELRLSDSIDLLDEAHIQTTVVAQHGWPMMCFRDALESIETQYAIDMVLIEFNAVLANDEHLVFRKESFGEKRNWKGFADDPAIVEALYSVTIAEKGETKVPLADNIQWRMEQNAKKEPLFLGRVADQMDAAEEQRREPRDYSKLGFVPFRSSLDIWQELSGVADISKFDRPWLATNRVSMASVERVMAFCRERDIPFMVYVPPRALDLRQPDGEMGRRQWLAARTSIAELHLSAAKHGFPVFDYDQWSDDFGLFRDSVHLAPKGVDLYSPQFFENLKNYLQRDAQGFEYLQFRNRD